MSTASPYRQLPLAFLVSPPDHHVSLDAARVALLAADHADDRIDRQRSTAALATRLAGVARTRGRTPVPKPSQRAPRPVIART